MKIKEIESIKIEIPWKEEIREQMRWVGSERYKSWLYKVHIDEGVIGLCENPLDIREKIPELIGRDPLDLLMDDSYWPLQEAFIDAVAQALGVPVCKLLGKKYRDEVAVCYWVHNFPPELLAKEAVIALEGGFKTIKFKVRPRLDPVKQVKSIAEVTDELSIIPDPNGTLWLPSKAIKFIREIEEYNILCVETPIPHPDIDGYLAIRDRVNIPIAAHIGYARPGVTAARADPIIAVSRGMCDYYVLEEPGVAVTIKIAAIAELATGKQHASGNEGKGYTFGGRPVWVEPFGRTGIGEAFQVHLGSTLKTAVLPGPLFIHRLLEHPLVEDPLDVKDGYVKVPDKPGLGVTLDEEALERYRVK